MASNHNLGGLMANLAMSPPGFSVHVVLPNMIITEIEEVLIDSERKRVYIMTKMGTEPLKDTDE